MNDSQHHTKITQEHRSRKAIVYLRQSSPKQVAENLESQRLQYAMVDRARNPDAQSISGSRRWSRRLLSNLLGTGQAPSLLEYVLRLPKRRRCRVFEFGSPYSRIGNIRPNRSAEWVKNQAFPDEQL